MTEQSANKPEGAKPLDSLPTWRQMNADTTPEAEALYFRLLRELPPWRKMKMLAALNRMANRIILASLREKHPEATQEELYYLLAERLHGPEIAARLRSRAAYDPD